MFDKILKFERALAEFTGAPYAIMTDCCTHAIEMCLRHDQITECSFTPYTYLSIPMLMHKLGIKYSYLDETEQTWVGEYPILGTDIWDSARRLEPGMYRPGQFQCLSFGWTKPLQLGKVGAILLDDYAAYKKFSRQRSDGRDLNIPWETETELILGYHYCPTLELCARGLELLPKLEPKAQPGVYPDCRKILINS